MKNNSKARLAGRAVLSLVTRSMHWFSWGIKYAVILPLATIALMALFIFWKDNTTPGQLLAEEIEFVRAIAPAGQFPVHDCPTDISLSQRCIRDFHGCCGIYRKHKSLAGKSVSDVLVHTGADVCGHGACHQKISHVSRKNETDSFDGG